MSTTYRLIALDEHGDVRTIYPVDAMPFNPADVLVVRVQGNPPQAEIERMRDRLHQLFPPERVLIVRGDVGLLRLEMVK